jgi:regulator of sigma E protease
MDILWMIGGFALILTPIIFIHELGHFLVARLFNIRIEEFGIGFPPRAVTLFERNGTVYSLNWIPLGGFVRPAGEDDPTVPGGLAAASKTARFFTLSAGAIFNFLFALFAFWLAFLIGPPAVSIGAVDPGSPAQVAGMEAGDIILEVNGQPVRDTLTLVTEVAAHAGEEVNVLVERGSAEQLLTVVPRRPGEYDATREGAIGIHIAQTTTRRYPLGPVEAVGTAARSISNIVTLTLRVPFMLARGELSAEEARPVGVVGISQIAGATAEYTADTGDWFQLLHIVAWISTALAFTNLLPIPALDGGRILFVLVEAVRGRRIEPEREGMVHLVGMLFLLALMFLLIIQDIRNPILP